MMKVTASRKNPVEVELVYGLLDEAAAQDYSLYSEILTKVLKAVPTAQLSAILDEFENIVYGG